MNAPRLIKLLAIDDNPENLALIAASLESEGLEILTGVTPRPASKPSCGSVPGSSCSIWSCQTLAEWNCWKE